MRRSRAFYLLVAAAVVVPLVVVGLVALGTANVTENPEPTAATYGALLERRAERADVRSEARPPSVLESAAGAGANAEDREASLEAPAERIRIDRIGVDAPLVVLNVGSDGNMEAPHGPEPVAWYDFTAKPGLGSGNAVFSGHRDWRDHGPAVFWDLEQLDQGDVIEIRLEDGSVLQYTVTSMHSYPVVDIPMREILATTERETLTLITCVGEFVAGDYTHRLIVRAVRSGLQPGS